MNKFWSVPLLGLLLLVLASVACGGGERSVFIPEATATSIAHAMETATAIVPTQTVVAAATATAVEATRVAHVNAAATVTRQWSDWDAAVQTELRNVLLAFVGPVCQGEPTEDAQGRLQCATKVLGLSDQALGMFGVDCNEGPAEQTRDSHTQSIEIVCDEDGSVEVIVSMWDNLDQGHEFTGRLLATAATVQE